MDIPEHDVIVVGAGNAATCAALSAKENGASVLQLEVSPEQYITQSYGELFQEWKHRTRSAAEDMTFAAVEVRS